MIQVLQDVRRGTTTLAEIPAPLVQPGHLLIANERSLLSAGTEKAAIGLAQKSLLGKARERPDHVRRVLQKVREEGVFETWRKVNAKLDEPMTMGYSSTGIVLACGDGVQDYKPGDRVASNGPHAEVVCVPKHLCARVPENVSPDQAAFTVLGAIAMQGVRLAKVSLGETAFVIGLGLVGQLTVALLKAAGCRVIGTDLVSSRSELALKMGADVARPNLKASDVEQLTGGLGADAVLITAATKSDAPVQLAARAVRQKGRIVLVGVADLHFDRRPMYFKEAEFVVSCSYGPGRYDADYEERGHDYPAAHVRWTEQRNLQAVLDLMDHGHLDVSPLISHRFPIQQAEEAYRLIEEDSEPYMGILLEYAKSRESRDESRELGEGGERRAESGEQKEGRKGAKVLIENRKSKIENDKIGVGVFGAGNFAKMVLIPKIAANSQMNSIGVCSAKGVSATHVGSKHGFQWATTDERDVFDDPNVDAVFLITRHDQHARHVLQALKAGKHVFVEKPLCLSVEELLAIEEVLAERARYEVRGASKEVRGQRPEARRQRSEVRDSQPSTLNSQPSRVIENQKSKIENPILMVGFNRRFSPTAKLVREFFSDTGAKKGSGTDCAKHPQDRSGKRF